MCLSAILKTFVLAAMLPFGESKRLGENDSARSLHDATDRDNQLIADSVDAMPGEFPNFALLEAAEMDRLFGGTLIAPNR